MSFEELNVLQKKARNIYLTCFIVIISGMSFCYFYFKSLQGALWIFLIGLLLSSIIISKYNKKFYSAFKSKYAKRIYDTFLKNISYEENSMEDTSLIEDTKCFKKAEYFESSDVVNGKYNDMNYHEAFLDFGSVGVDSDGHNRTSPYFSGKWITFEFKKSFLNEFHIYSKGIIKYGINKKDKDFEKFETSNEIFNKRFTIYAKNMLDTQKIINDDMINKLNNLFIDINVPFVMCIKENKLHIGIYTFKNNLNYSIFKKINEEEIINLLSKNYKIITKFIDEINTNNILFK